MAHRGWPAQFPENTIAGFAAAIARGARWIECDVQLTADGIPILFHDESLRRSCGREALVTEIRFDELPPNSASFPGTYGDKFVNHSIDPLAALLTLLDDHAHVRAFVELKSESAASAGYEAFMTSVNRVLREPAREDRVAAVISLDLRLVEMAAQLSWPVGWVLPAWNEGNGRLAQELAPDYLFCDVNRLPLEKTALWQGSWRWIAYTVNQLHEMAEWLNYGMQMVESDDVGIAL